MPAARRLTIYRVRRHGRDGVPKGTAWFASPLAAARRAAWWRSRGWTVTVDQSTDRVTFAPAEDLPDPGPVRPAA